MKFALLAFVCGLGILEAVFAAAAPSSPNVILLTLDGVRWQEVFHGADAGQSLDPDPKVFDFLLGELSKQGPLYGDKLRGESVTVANKAHNSLPGYQSIMAGATQPCATNACGRIQVETFPERLVRELGLKPAQVATVASWEKIAHAVEHVEGATWVNAGNRAVTDADEADAALDRQQASDLPPWKDARYDKYTFARALRYLKTQQPRFLFISLNDSDEWGHKGDYPKYLATLRQHDAWIKELVTTLDGLGEYGKQTTLIVTTDHGRGEGNDWNDHGSGIKGSGAVWLYGRSPHSRATSTQRRTLAAAKEVQVTHLDIRPTIEATFGLVSKAEGGKALKAIVGESPRLPALVQGRP